MDTSLVYNEIAQISGVACQRMNEFSSRILKTRGGRIGSGMGALLEALWGYMMNEIIAKNGALDCEIAWFPDNQYNDFSCIKKNVEWNPETRDGEYFRIEVKSMNLGADESKAHFAAIKKEIENNDALLILVWKWKKIDGTHYSPFVTDSFFDKALEVAKLRDDLHCKRNGTFVDENECPDNCRQGECTHVGEPLNANKKRERLSGPESTKPSAKVSHAANFGGLVRMIKTNNDQAREELRELRKASDIADHYISFIYRNYPSEEKNQYKKAELRKIAKCMNIDDYKVLSRDNLYEEIRKHDGYQSLLRYLL